MRLIDFLTEYGEAAEEAAAERKRIENLKKLFNQKYPGVIFTFTTKASNTYNNAGFIHENSNVKNGTKVVQGKTYTVTITS